MKLIKKNIDLIIIILIIIFSISFCENKTNKNQIKNKYMKEKETELKEKLTDESLKIDSINLELKKQTDNIVLAKTEQTKAQQEIDKTKHYRKQSEQSPLQTILEIQQDFLIKSLKKMDSLNLEKIHSLKAKEIHLNSKLDGYKELRKIDEQKYKDVRRPRRLRLMIGIGAGVIIGAVATVLIFN